MNKSEQETTRELEEIRADIEKLDPVKNRKALLEALPLLIEMKKKIEAENNKIDACGEIAKRLNDACADYALAHEGSVFINGLVTDGKDVRRGDVKVDGVSYHFAAGYDGFKRIDGNNLTKEFLSGLPKSWTMRRTMLDKTAIKKLGVTAEDLEKAGLVKSPKNVWSLQ